jgi:hypothetical protein
VTTFILTWNGSEDGYPATEYQLHQQRTLSGERVPYTWSFGRRSSGVSEGDRVFLLRQHTDRGIVASGQIRGNRGIFRDRHWDPAKPQEKTNYADVEWDIVVSLEERLPIEDVLTAIPGHHWNYIQASGQELQSPGAGRLEELWSQHLAEIGYAGLTDAGVRVETVPVEEATSVPGVADAVELESAHTDRYQTSPSSGHEAVRREQQLVQRYEEHLAAMGHECKRYKISVPGEDALYTDIADKTDMVLYEAKGDASRESIRTAVGQLLDYRRHIEPTPTVAVLLPRRPKADLLGLLNTEGIGCVFEDGIGHFRNAGV